jgi:uncharacterized integral membrane protein
VTTAGRPQQEPPGRRSGGLSEAITPRTIGLIVLAVVFVAWTIANRETVRINFLFFDAELQLFVALILAGVIGLGVGYLLASRRTRK